jgi:Tfp pilus assembly protein PilN
MIHFKINKRKEGAKMKEYKLILLAFLIIVAVSLFIILNEKSSLDERNNILVNNIKQLSERITLLEQDRTMEKITTLKAENAALKKEIKVLMAQLNTASREAVVPSQETTVVTKEVIKQEVSPTGNRGFLKKESKPTR